MLSRLSRITNKPARTAVQQNFADKAFQTRRSFEGAYFSTGRALTVSSLLFGLPMVDMAGPPLLNLLGFSAVSALGLFGTKRPSIRLATLAGFAMAGGFAGDPFVSLFGTDSPSMMLFGSSAYGFIKAKSRQVKLLILLGLFAVPKLFTMTAQAVMFIPGLLALPAGFLAEAIGTRISARRLDKQINNFNQELPQLLQHEEISAQQIVEQLMLTPRVIGRRGSLRFNDYLLKALLYGDQAKLDQVTDLLMTTSKGQKILKKVKFPGNSYDI